MCLIDAEDYSDLPVRQYEEDNVLRELNKAYLAFRQHYPQAAAPTPGADGKQRLAPVGASRDSSPTASDPRDAAPWQPAAHGNKSATFDTMAQL